MLQKVAKLKTRVTAEFEDCCSKYIRVWEELQFQLDIIRATLRTTRQFWKQVQFKKIIY